MRLRMQLTEHKEPGDDANQKNPTLCHGKHFCAFCARILQLRADNDCSHFSLGRYRDFGRQLGCDEIAHNS